MATSLAEMSPRSWTKLLGFLGENIRNDVPLDEDFVGGFFWGYFGFNPKGFRSLGIILFRMT